MKNTDHLRKLFLDLKQSQGSPVPPADGTGEMTGEMLGEAYSDALRPLIDILHSPPVLAEIRRTLESSALNIDVDEFECALGWLIGASILVEENPRLLNELAAGLNDLPEPDSKSQTGR